MKTTKRHLNVLGLFFSALIFFQGCTVYKSTPVSIEQAVQNESKVKVITKSNEKFKFNRIRIEDSNYYGYNSKERIPLDQNNIDTIKEKNKTLSTVLNIVIPVFTIVGLLGLLVAASGGLCC